MNTEREPDSQDVSELEHDSLEQEPGGPGGPAPTDANQPREEER